MIFVVGQQNLTPWDKEAEQLLILLRMSRSKEKIIFTSQFGFICQHFLVNINYE